MPKSSPSDKRRRVLITAGFKLYSEKDFLGTGGGSRSPKTPEKPQGGTNKEQGH